MAGKYWLVKTEPTSYSIENLKKDGRTFWHGVRNYQARNFMRDEMAVGDQVLFYHSNANPSGVVGMAKVVKAGYGDHTALDGESPYHDPKATKENPVWFMVDLAFVKKFKSLLSLAELKQIPGLEKMGLLQKGTRLSVMPVTEKEFKIIEKLGNA